MTNSLRIVRNTMYLYIKTGLTVFIVLYTTRIILKNLGETDFGIYNIVGGVISMLGFLNTAMAVSIQRFLNYEQGKGNINSQKTIFNVGLIFHVVIALIISLMLLLLGYVLFNGVLNIPSDRMFASKVVYGSLIVSTAFTIMTVPYDACLNAHENMLFYSVVGIIEALLKLAVALIVVNSTQDKLVVYGILMSIVPIISMILMRIYCHRNYQECNISIRKYFDKTIAKELGSFAGWNFLGSSSNYLGNYGNMITMNHFCGAGLNAVMGIANQLQGQLMVLSSGMLKALNPVIAKEEGAGNSGSMLKYSLKGCEFSFFLLAFFAIPFLMETPCMLRLWLRDYPKWTVLFVQLQLVRALLEQFTVSLSKALEAKNRIAKYNLFVFLFNIIPIPILCILYSLGYPPYWHYIIAIISMVIIPSLIKIYLCKHYCGLNLFDFSKMVAMPIFYYVITSVIICMFARKVFSSDIMSFIFVFFINSILILLFSFFSLSKNERQLVLSKIRCLK